MKFIAFITLLSLPLSAIGQNILVKETPPIGSMMDKYASLNADNTEIDGWRIQLLATTDRQKLEEELRRFKMLYPGISVDWSHSKPYYKLRAGAYISRLDTYHMLHVIKDDYPGAYPAKDKLKPRELLN